jgi:hypothetical protein
MRPCLVSVLVARPSLFLSGVEAPDAFPSPASLPNRRERNVHNIRGVKALSKKWTVLGAERSHQQIVESKKRHRRHRTAAARRAAELQQEHTDNLEEELSAQDDPLRTLSTRGLALPRLKLGIYCTGNNYSP